MLKRLMKVISRVVKRKSYTVDDFFKSQEKEKIKPIRYHVRPAFNPIDESKCKSI